MAPRASRVQISPQALLDRYSNEEVAAMVVDLTDLVDELTKRSHSRRRSHSGRPYLTDDVFAREAPNYLRLLGTHDEVQMSSDDLVEELLSIVKLRDQANLYEGTYVYGITLSHGRKQMEGDALRQLAGISNSYLAQIEAGYLHHELIYSLVTSTLNWLLRTFLEGETVIEISLKPSAESVSVRRKVHLDQAAPIQSMMTASSEA